MNIDKQTLDCLVLFNEKFSKCFLTTLFEYSLFIKPNYSLDYKHSNNNKVKEPIYFLNLNILNWTIEDFHYFFNLEKIISLNDLTCSEKLDSFTFNLIREYISNQNIKFMLKWGNIYIPQQKISMNMPNESYFANKEDLFYAFVDYYVKL